MITSAASTSASVNPPPRPVCGRRRSNALVSSTISYRIHPAPEQSHLIRLADFFRAGYFDSPEEFAAPEGWFRRRPIRLKLDVGDAPFVREVISNSKRKSSASRKLRLFAIHRLGSALLPPIPRTEAANLGRSIRLGSASRRSRPFDRSTESWANHRRRLALSHRSRTQTSWPPIRASVRERSLKARAPRRHDRRQDSHYQNEFDQSEGLRRVPKSVQPILRMRCRSRSADLQSAVSPIWNRRRVGSSESARVFGRPAG